MKKTNLAFLLIVTLIISVTILMANTNNSKSDEEAKFAEANTASENLADDPFTKMMDVLTHKRCVNCHPSDNFPRQGEDSHIHNFGVQRGADNHGVAALRCETCHSHENNDYSGVPGEHEWSLAPISMRWQGLSRVEIAKSMLDRKNNGNRSLDEIVKHLTEHALVLWAWEPGIDAAGNPRETPPVPKDEYIKAVKEWAAAGAPIPEK